MKWTGIVLSFLAGALFTLAATYGLLPQYSKEPLQQPGAIDVGFAQAMTLHHRQAVAMSQLMLDGRPTRVAWLAQSIVAAQTLELGQMQGWLMLWRESVQVSKPNMGWMLLAPEPPDKELEQYLLDCESSPTGMPGLATMTELNQIRSLAGAERDRVFLQLMLAHHQGGIPMARFIAEHGELEVVRNLGRNIVLEQSKEMYLIQRMLAALEDSESIVN